MWFNLSCLRTTTCCQSNITENEETKSTKQRRRRTNLVTSCQLFSHQRFYRLFAIVHSYCSTCGDIQFRVWLQWTIVSKLLLRLRKSDCSTLVSSIHIASLELLSFGKQSQQHARQIPLACNRATNPHQLTLLTWLQSNTRWCKLANI